MFRKYKSGYFVRTVKSGSEKTNQEAIAAVQAVIYGSLEWVEMKKIDLLEIVITDSIRTW